MSDQDHITLIVLTPDKTLIDKKVSKVSLPGTKGRFMVMKDHAPLISSLEEGDVVFESSGVTGKIGVVSGFVEVAGNVVTVCAEL